MDKHEAHLAKRPSKVSSIVPMIALSNVVIRNILCSGPDKARTYGSLVAWDEKTTKHVLFSNRFGYENGSHIRANVCT